METAPDYTASKMGSRLFGWLLLAVIVLILLSVAVNVGGRLLGPLIARGGHSDSTHGYEIIIGNNVLSIPANMIRFSNQRRDGVTRRLDLYARWPGLTGYTERDRAIFNLLTSKRHLIFMSIEQRTMSRDMSGRYLAIYAELIDPNGETAPGNLTVHRFLESSGYKGEELVLSDPSSGKPEFVARCLADSGAESFNSCERDVQFGRDLQILYRFPRSMLGEWKSLDKAIVDFANAHLLGNDTKQID
ncbi:hypothetical protein ACRRRS_06740 [Brucella anthropi]|jgi:hypothetical protein|uniref:Transmembrane anchored protein n=2 Tax=Brucella anthropi TaxID=529 RepID=A0A6I0DS43_BRUAN|nr:MULTISPECIES: hypothetical protein [Brucella/Ochrobactrum group]MCR5943018.1 hypothetical protein [Ochrobactrum sp. XJ1]QTN02949.1 hypothetical protein GTN27_07110 [Ochrobactrum sp. EEELCW01]KAB2737976.1 hypothetical protein F9K89_12005 [Brucella anthropi]KAB2760423.1 hypothetical protein F9K81_02935 [Brucella anthropi]KAB2771635.1 hypothetical protein F9K84_02815 [Brucella anthropi]